MTYLNIATMGADSDLTSRIQACAAQEGVKPDPFQWTTEHQLVLAAAPGWDQAWASAQAGGNAAPGRDAAVITDAMILAAVQALVAKK